jgi:hypothetical protein
MKNVQKIVGLILLGFVFGCSHIGKDEVIVVKNKLNQERISETVVIPLAELHVKDISNLPGLLAKNVDTGEYYLK